ncbi:MAG: (2Fe-2S) ferredoxin domain-containing protein [Planctomycetota bacterium]
MTIEVPTDEVRTKSRRQAQVALCKGCCCGRVDRGHPEVPVDSIKAAWNEHDLRTSVQLTVSGCLGPCDVSNVVLLMMDGEQIWLGGLHEPAHYVAVIAWALDVAERGAEAELPESLKAHRFERWANDA